MRLFVGIELEGAAREAVLKTRDELVDKISGQGVRFVRPEKIHLTLAFLGNVDEANVAGLTTALAKVECPTICLHLNGIGAFPDARRPKVIWIGLDGEVDRLTALANQVKGAARAFAPELDEKPFSPHITLCRIKPGSKETGRILPSIAGPDKADWIVGRFHLIHSKPDGTYHKLS